jgi:acyl-CoA hydrolase
LVSDGIIRDLSTNYRTSSTEDKPLPPKSSAVERRVVDSVVQMTEIVLPEDSNYEGSIFGGRVLALIDKCAAIVAMRHSRSVWDTC